VDVRRIDLLPLVNAALERRMEGAR
jgi:hypothetical protein